MIIKGDMSIDQRGTVRFVNGFDFQGKIKRFYQVSNFNKGFIRAWHGHKIEQKYVYVAKGSIEIGIVNMETEETKKFILSDKKPCILYIPAGNYNGFRTLEKDTIVIFFSTLTIDEARDDDYRKQYSDYPILEIEYK